jgi:hypothetical protein
MVSSCHQGRHDVGLRAGAFCQSDKVPGEWRVSIESNS